MRNFIYYYMARRAVDDVAAIYMHLYIQYIIRVIRKLCVCQTGFACGCARHKMCGALVKYKLDGAKSGKSGALAWNL